ncbi:hypothetical protein FHS15_003354 [Paenibacillus castaneae]|uniref:hypothetical protein n=1 Tax=Paenibacillus castaneae TaxID=474957 RepID=UPI001ABA1A40|nr:hypothetical protein [Paenibacillus castaneae]NIK78216.1 hypothetical protein [Paenibacillus castaneae]
MKINISDWVRGKTREGELIHGFIESFDILQGIVVVNVVESDNEDIVGKKVAVREQWLKPVPEITLADDMFMLNLIDISLATRDEAWFMELTNYLKSNGNEAIGANHASEIRSKHINRLGPVGR